MKYGRFLAVVLVFCFVLSGMALATEPVGGDGDSAPSAPVETGTDSGTDTGTDTTVPADDLTGEESTSEEVPGEEIPGEETSGDVTDWSTDWSIDPVVMGYSDYTVNAPEERTESTIAAAVVSVFGEYQPITHTVTDHLSDGTSVTYEQVVPGLAGVDWVWVSGVGIFALMLYSLFRLLGVFVK